MRILMANWHQGLIAGAEAYLREVVPALRGRGHDVRLAVEYRAEPARPTIDPGGPPPWLLTGPDAEEVWGEVAAWPADVCVIHGLEDPRRQARLLDRFPALLFAHNYHGTCISGSKRHGFPSEQPCSRIFGPSCLLLYHLRRCGGMSPLPMMRDYRAQAARKALLTRYRGVIVASRHMAAEYVRHGLPPERVHCLPLFPAAPGSDSGPDPERGMSGRLCFVGRLGHVKGGHHAIRATALAAGRLGRRLTLVFVGDGPDRSRLEALAARQRVAVEFAGWVSPQRRNEWLGAADLLLVPSTWPEPFGLVGVEAGCLGVPAAGFAVGGVLDWLIPGVSGEVAPADPCRPEALAEAVVRAIGSEDHWRALCRGAQETARRFTLAAHLDGLERLLAGVAFKDVSRPASPSVR